MQPLPDPEPAPALEPDWDLSSFFPSVESPEFVQASRVLAQDLARWEEVEPPWTAAHLLALESLQARGSHLVSYLQCEFSARTDDAAIKRAFGTHSALDARIEAALARTCVQLGRLSETEFQRLLESDEMEGRRFYVGRLRQKALASMGEGEETLASELGATGVTAWERLRDAVTGPLTFDLEVDGEATRSVPISQYRLHVEDPRAEIRKAAFEGASAAWESIAIPCAAALNAMVGSRWTLNRHRGIHDVLAPSALDNFVEVETIEALMGTLRDRPEVLRSLLREKARVLGVDRLDAADLVAPETAGDAAVDSWDAAGTRLLVSLGRTFPELASFARTAIDQRWVDHSIRPNKAAGGYCITSGVTRESRIFMTFGGTMGCSGTLAHELGHAHHSYLLRDLPPWAGEYPSTVAETASTFAEAAAAAGVLAELPHGHALRAAVRAHRRTHAIEYLANTLIRFDIEAEIYRRRAEGELSIDELKAITLEVQCSLYGDAVDPDSLSPWLWASVQHFYFSFATFYNYPYTFGFLLSSWLWSQVESEGEPFLERYIAFLRASGTSTAEDAAETHLGVDLRERSFWDAALDGVESAFDSQKA